MEDKVNAIILAGTHADETKLINGKNKAFLEINNKPIIYYTLQVLQDCDYINQNKIAVVGPRKNLEEIIQNKKIKIIDESSNPNDSKRFLENCAASYDYISPNGERTVFLPEISR